ncbi:MAG: hypothetical protein H6556_23070 [Lewinellaceae bacterium]|nr:hypothetical protein [Lewinellaceae bacterium]
MKAAKGRRRAERRAGTALSVGNALPLFGAEVSSLPAAAGKQSWRRLKQQSFRESTEEVNVPETVQALARNGFFYELVFETRKVSRQHFVVLLDHGGSMTPHHYLFRFFIQGLRESTLYTKIETYYFTNYPLYQLGNQACPNTGFHQYGAYRFSLLE